ncbi:Cell division protein FtsX [[Actinomadura] parvosata subsp. kistnae]|nr:Cell division protein FtsX [Actinomadura parvosata subsp. kistnae]
MVRVAAVTLAVAVMALAVVRLAVPSLEPQESVIAMALSGAASAAGPEVSVFLCKDGDSWASCAGGEITKPERLNLQRALEGRPEVESVRFEDRQQAWESFRRQYEDDPELLKATTPTDMPESFRARIRAGADASAVARAASELPGVSISFDQACLVDNGWPWGLVKRLLGSDEQCSFMGKGQ